GEALAAVGKPQPAIADFDAAISLDPTLIAAYCGRGLAIAKAGKPLQAIIELTKAGGRIRLDLRFASAIDCRARVYYSIGQYQRAVMDYDLVAQLNPPGHNHAASLYGRALSLLQLGDAVGGEAALKQALGHDGNHGDARAALRWLHGDRATPLAALRRPANVMQLPAPPVVSPPVSLGPANPAWNVEPVWDQWIVRIAGGTQFGPVTKAARRTGPARSMPPCWPMPMRASANCWKRSIG
ncbi:MAG: tetratricopeptide repeat protein, partial [Planctomycetales bacterium]|nr:tetratricopeptide repeat protein [Planctomycetales bacterium]